jgi:hypothetical protein
MAKWPEGCSALLVPDPFSSQANTYAIHENALAEKQSANQRYVNHDSSVDNDVDLEPLHLC